MLSRSGLCIATSAGVVALSATMSHAGEDVWIWIGPNGGSFHDALNWDPDSVPGPQDTAVFEETGRYTVLFSQSVVNTVLNVDDGEASFEMGFQSYQVNELVVADHIDVVPLVRLTLLHGTVSVVSPGFFVRIGKDPGATGELFVSTGTNFISSEDVLIGDAGSGLLVVLNGGTASTATTFLGEDVGADGTATVQGPNSQWTNSGSLIVGNLGTGSLNVLGGGSVSTNVSFLGDDPGAVGSAIVDGSGSTYDHSASLFVGNFGTGSLTITNGGSVSAERTFIGDDPGSNGSVTVQGKGSSWTNTIAVFVGNFGTGAVTVSNGGSATASILKIGDETGAVGTAVVDGTGSSWVSSTDLVVGNRGSGTLTVSNGGSASAANGFIGDDPGSVGNVTITGAGSSLTCTTQLAVGRLGEGNLTVSDGATATAPLVTINNQSSMNGDGAIQADVTNDGTVAPGLSVGQLAIEGSYLQTALEHFTVQATSGQVIALVGPSGAGKSTVLNLLLRLYDPRSGCITLNGRDIRQYTIESLRQGIAVVPQQSILFALSVRDNIAHGAPDASPEQIIAAARLASAHDFIIALPQGYDTMLGERGETISDGERQRVAIARAAVRAAPILLLDEPTTGLDNENSRLVGDALRTLSNGRISFIVAHDLTTIEEADLILYLDHGRIVEQGTHAQLMAQGGQYAAMYALQTGPSGPHHIGRPHAVSG